MQSIFSLCFLALNLFFFEFCALILVLSPATTLPPIKSKRLPVYSTPTSAPSNGSKYEDHSMICASKPFRRDGIEEREEAGEQHET